MDKSRGKIGGWGCLLFRLFIEVLAALDFADALLD